MCCGVLSTAHGLKLNVKVREASLRADHTLQVKVGGREVAVPLSGAFTLERGNSAVTLDARLEGDLSNVQQAFPALVRQALERHEPCGDRLRAERAELVPAGDAALARAWVKYERWFCPGSNAASPPRRLLEQSGYVAMRLTPALIDGGRAVRLVRRTTEVKLDGLEPPLAGLVERVLKERIEQELGDLFGKERARAALPRALRPYLRLRSARFVDRGQGVLGFEALGGAVIDAAQATEICGKLVPGLGC